MESTKTIGIIGGMGPLASADMLKKVVELEECQKDQDHVRIVVDCASNIPDRASAIYNEAAESPVPEIIRCAVGLERSGADVLIMACNIAHYFYNDILPYTRVPFLSILEETSKAVLSQGLTSVAIMACKAAIDTGIYGTALERHGIWHIYPSDECQDIIQQTINDVKAGRQTTDLEGMTRAIKELTDAGAQALVLANTELPVAFELYAIPCEIPLVDPTAELAKSALRCLDRRIKE